MSKNKKLFKKSESSRDLNNPKYLIVLIAVICLLASPLFQISAEEYIDVGKDNPYILKKGAKDIPELIKGIINTVLGVIGAIALIMFIYGGIILLASAGRPEWIKKGWGILTWAVIGLFTIFVSYTAVHFVLKGLEGEEGAGEKEEITEETKEFQCEEYWVDCDYLGKTTCEATRGCYWYKERCWNHCDFRLGKQTGDAKCYKCSPPDAYASTTLFSECKPEEYKRDGFFVCPEGYRCCLKK